MMLKEVPVQRAVFDTTLADLMQTIHRIYDEWMPTSAHGGTEFEFYGPDPSVPGSVMQLFIPSSNAVTVVAQGPPIASDGAHGSALAAAGGRRCWQQPLQPASSTCVRGCRGSTLSRWNSRAVWALLRGFH
ncbi:MAG: hypothetical protein R2851_24370 [Caldilineaceae bacterium]